MIFSLWPEWFRERIGAWPLDYCTFDVETTGFGKDDLLTGVGHCLVCDGKVIDRLELIVDLDSDPDIDSQWLAHKLARLDEQMRGGGGIIRGLYERMRREGLPLREVLAFYAELFDTLLAGGVRFAAHNGYRFDEVVLARHFERIGRRNFTLGDDFLFDTCALERANQLTDRPQALPRRDDTLRSYCRRLLHVHGPGVQSNLDTHCCSKYGFAVKYGLDMKQAHTAAFDSFLVHLLMEEFRAGYHTPLEYAAPQQRDRSEQAWRHDAATTTPPPPRRRRQRNC